MYVIQLFYSTTVTIGVNIHDRDCDGDFCFKRPIVNLGPWMCSKPPYQDCIS